MSWWWEYFDARNLTPYLTGVRMISDQMLAAGKGEFVEVRSRADAAASLAVRCGPKTFACVYNPTAAPVEVTLRLGDGHAGSPRLDWFNPEDRQWRAGGAVTQENGEWLVPGLSLRPEETRILVLQ
jgi:hypothetical protein